MNAQKAAYDLAKANSARLRGILNEKRDWHESAKLHGEYIDAILAERKACSEYLEHEYRLEFHGKSSNV